MTVAMGAIVVRFGLYVALMLLFGLACFGLYALRGGERRSGATLRFTPLLAGSAIAAEVLSVLGLLTVAASMAGVSLAALDRQTVAIVLGTAAGVAWEVRTVAILVAALVPLAGRRHPRLALVAVAFTAGTAIATLAWTGHGAMDEGASGWVHLLADIFHLLAAAVWLGALVALVLLAFRKAERADRDHVILLHRVLKGFSTVGTAIVAIIVISGLVNSWMMVGLAQVAQLPYGLYGQLLIAKLALFAGMVLLAAANRFHLTPAFALAIANNDHQSAIVALRRSLAFETACAIAILGLVAWLGTLEPPLSAMS